MAVVVVVRALQPEPDVVVRALQSEPDIAPYKSDTEFTSRL